MSDPQKSVSALIRSLTVPTAMVFIAPDDMKMSAYRNSFQQRVNEKMPAESRPGTDRGRMIFTRIWSREQPPAIALSSISLGIERKYPIRGPGGGGGEGGGGGGGGRGGRGG